MRLARTHSANPSRGFTLLESLAASAILLGVVVAVTGAISAGQQHSFEANQRIAGTLAAEEMLSRLVKEDYSSLDDWDEHEEAVGSMTDEAGDPMPDSFAAVGRSVTITTVLKSVPTLSVRVRGKDVSITAFDASDRTLAQLTRFVPEPQS